jgi:hypothetical protein
LTSALAASPARADDAQPSLAQGLLGDFRPALGLGATIRSDKITGKLVPASLTWYDNRYELFVAYFRDQEISGLRLNGYPAHIGLAPPLWALSFSRRVQFVDRPRFKAFLGVGGAWLDTSPCQSPDQANDRTPHLDYYEPVYHGCDKLNGSRLNFALQLGARLYSTDGGIGVDLTFRHISNGGMTSGNRGEDFVTAQFVF